MVQSHIRFSNFNGGFSVIEILLSVFVIGFVVTGLLAAVQYSVFAASEIGNRNRAALYANEGLEAVRNMRDSDYDLLVDGTHGLAIVSGRWTFSGNSDTANGLTRQVAVSAFSGSAKQITSTVTWPKRQSGTGSVSVTSYLVNPSPGPAGEATYLVVNTNGATVGGTGNRNLLGITLSNSGLNPIVIDQITVDVSGNRSLTEIVIGGVSVWSGPSSTPVTADITDVIINPGQTLPINSFSFNASVNGLTHTITFIMQDGTTKSLVWP